MITRDHLDVLISVLHFMGRKSLTSRLEGNAEFRQILHNIHRHRTLSFTRANHLWIGTFHPL